MPSLPHFPWWHVACPPLPTSLGDTWQVLLGTVLPLERPASSASQFRGGLRIALKARRRPHVVFGTKEYEQGREPIFLPSSALRVRSIFHRYVPSYFPW